MQYVLLLIILCLTLRSCRRIRFWQRMGIPRRAKRCYRRAAWTLGLTVYGAMLTQEAILLACGRLTLATGLPLHLCSLMGVLTLPMLLTRRPWLCHMSVYAGIPGAALALIFPAVLDTPWPMLTALAFHTLHAGLIAAPLLPVALGFQPVPWGAWTTWKRLAVIALCVCFVNALTGGNYLFLAAPVAGTPLVWLSRWGLTVYRLLLALLATLVLVIEGALASMLMNTKKPQERR